MLLPYWIFTLVTRAHDGTFSAHTNETLRWTLRGLSWERHAEAWVFEAPIDEQRPATLLYHLAERGAVQQYHPPLTCLPAEAAALIRCTHVEAGE